MRMNRAIGMVVFLACASESAAWPDSGSIPAAELQPMPAATVRQMVVGHAIDESPYPPDTGPTEFFADGVIAFHGTLEGMRERYVVAGNQIIVPSMRNTSFSFFLDRKGHFYYRSDGGRDLKLAFPLRLGPLPPR